MKESLSEQEEVSTRSKRARKRVQDSNFVFIWFWIPDLWIYLLARHVQGTFDEDKHENQMFSLSIVYCFFFYYLRSDSQQTTKKARYDAICVQECPNCNIWGYGLRSKRFEGSRLYSKIILGFHGKKFRAPGLRPPPPYPPPLPTPQLGPYYIDTSVLLENTPPIKFIKTTSGTAMVYFPWSRTWVLSMT